MTAHQRTGALHEESINLGCGCGPSRDTRGEGSLRGRASEGATETRERHPQLQCLLRAVVTCAEAQEATTAGILQHSVWRPVWFIAGPITTQVSLDESDNELRIEGNEIVLVLADGQRWAAGGCDARWHYSDLGYFRATHHPSARSQSVARDAALTCSSARHWPLHIESRIRALTRRLPSRASSAFGSTVAVKRRWNCSTTSRCSLTSAASFNARRDRSRSL